MRRRLLLTTLAAALTAGCGDTSESTPPPVDELPCPPSRVDADAAVCAHRVDESPVLVRATGRSASTTALRFVLTNGTGETLEFNPHNPDVYRYVGEQGYSLVERRSSGSGVITVPPEGTYEWLLSDLPQADQLGPGAYLFSIRVPTAGTMEPDWVTCLAPFRLTDV